MTIRLHTNRAIDVAFTPAKAMWSDDRSMIKERLRCCVVCGGETRDSAKATLAVELETLSASVQVAAESGGMRPMVLRRRGQSRYMRIDE
jgi:hypothetical protein